MGEIKYKFIENGIERIVPQFPHCDQRILHKPGECEFCDMHPEWQQLREFWGIAFTGHSAEKTEDMLPCPAEVRRPVSVINKWYGNVPENAENKAKRDSYFARLKDLLRFSPER